MDVMVKKTNEKDDSTVFNPYYVSPSLLFQLKKKLGFKNCDSNAYSL